MKPESEGLVVAGCAGLLGVIEKSKALPFFSVPSESSEVNKDANRLLQEVSLPWAELAFTVVVVGAWHEVEVVFIPTGGLSPNLKERPLPVVVVVVVVGSVDVGALDPNVKVLAGLNEKLLPWVEAWVVGSLFPNAEGVTLSGVELEVTTEVGTDFS